MLILCCKYFPNILHFTKYDVWLYLFYKCILTSIYLWQQISYLFFFCVCVFSLFRKHEQAFSIQLMPWGGCFSYLCLNILLGSPTVIFGHIYRHQKHVVNMLLTASATQLCTSLLARHSAWSQTHFANIYTKYALVFVCINWDGWIFKA